MPNRTDQSVKTRQRDRDRAVKTYLLVGGAFLSGIGALAVMLTGGTFGLLTGIGIFTLLIILQVLALQKPKDLMRAPPEEQGQVTTPQVAQNDPILAINVSDLGRVRSIYGRADYLKGLRIGVELDRLLSPDQRSVEATAPDGPMTLSVMTFAAPKGRLVVLVPQTEDNGAVREQVQERTNFFAGLGHDLKSPLNAVIGFADIMDAEIRGPMPEAYRDYPGLIRESGEALLRLVEDMLGYARSEAGTYDLDVTPMDIAASGESVLRQSQVLADRAGVQIRMLDDGEVLALADAAAVRRIWDNLVSNAIKYSASGDTVTLNAFIADGRAMLQVRDTGAGMDAADLARIAKPFSQGQNAKGRAGTGLGLALVHRLAEMQKGRVKIETAPGRGTTVTVELPAVSADQKRAAE